MSCLEDGIYVFPLSNRTGSHLVSANLTVRCFQMFVSNASLLTGFNEQRKNTIDLAKSSHKTSRVETVRNLSLHLLTFHRNTSIFD